MTYVFHSQPFGYPAVDVTPVLGSVFFGIAIHVVPIEADAYMSDQTQSKTAFKFNKKTCFPLERPSDRFKEPGIDTALQF